MSDSDTGETSRFKINILSQLQMLRVLSAAAITTRMMIIRPCSLLHHKKLTNTKREKNKRKRELSPESSSSDSGNSSSSEESLEEGNSTKSHGFQIISKSESHKWELPGEMADYINHQFECFIPEKDVEENPLVLQLVPENVRGVKKLNDFVKSIMRQSAQALNQDAIMEKFQQKILYVLGPLSRLWKGLEDIKNAPDDTVPVPVEDHIKLIEQTVLLLGQASNSILYSRRLQILKTLIKDPKKAKNILKEKADLLQKGNQNLFGKKFRSHVVETERSKKGTLEVFSGGNRSALPPAKKPFWIDPSPNSNKLYGGGGFYYSKKPSNQDRHNPQYGGKQNNKWSSNVSLKQSSWSKTSSLVQKISRIDSRRVSSKCSTFSKKFVYRKNPNLQLAGRLAHFSNN